MAGIEHLVSIDELKTNLLSQRAEQTSNRIFSNYDPDADALIFQIVAPETHTIVHYVDEHIGLLYQADDLEIVGLRVENFRHSFLPEHSAVERVWKLNDAEIKVADVGDLILVLNKTDRKVRQVAQEVAKATEIVLGEKGSELAAAFA